MRDKALGASKYWIFARDSRISGISTDRDISVWCCHSPWWRHQMKTFSALLAICAGNSPVTGEFPAHKGQWRGALMFSLICAWMNGWVNNREAGDLRCHPAHYDVIVMHRNAIHNTWVYIQPGLSYTMECSNPCLTESLELYCCRTKYFNQQGPNTIFSSNNENDQNIFFSHLHSLIVDVLIYLCHNPNGCLANV